MATTLANIRYLIEREVKDTIENDDVINWCNQVNMEIGTNINIPGEPAIISLNSTDLEYDLPADLKIINRLRLQSVIDEGLDHEFGTNFRIYNGKIVLPRVLWIAPDDLAVDYFKHMTYFSDISDNIDLPDRFTPLYTFYGNMKYYHTPAAVQRMNDANARKAAEAAERIYLNMKNQVTSYYSLSNEPVIVEGRW